MNAFVSWSSGKDCMYALHRFLRSGGSAQVVLMNMTDVNSDLSRSHGIRTTLVARQAEHMGLPILQCPTLRGRYEEDFKAGVRTLRDSYGVEAGVFGDIYLREHRVWVERVCGDLGVIPIFPLWGQSTEELMRGFVEDGFRSVVVALRKECLSVEYLGRTIDEDFILQLSNMSGVDVCGENGEYHSYVYDGPIFESPVPIRHGAVTEDARNFFLELI